MASKSKTDLPETLSNPKGDSQSERIVDNSAVRGSASSIKKVDEVAGPKGPEPTRFGDWEKNGRCSDF